MNGNEMNQTEWQDGQGNAIEKNDPAALAENADGKWQRVNEFSVTETTINGKKIPTGASHFNGYKMNMSAEAEVTKGETAAIWLGVLGGILLGCLVGYAKNFMLGIYFGICIPSCSMVAVGAKALLRKDPEKNKKIVVMMCGIIIGSLVFIGIVMALLFH